MPWKTYTTVAAAQNDLFGQAHAVHVSLRNSDVTDESLADYLRLFPKLHSLDIADTSLTEAGLSKLRDFPFHNFFAAPATCSSSSYPQKWEVGQEPIRLLPLP